MMNSPLRIELFGGLQLVQGANEITNRFQTRKTAAMLAYLAYHRGKVVSREVLTDLLWPDADPASSRNSFRVALNSLRRQLEPPEIPPGAVLFADRASVQLKLAICTTDVAEFEEALRDEKNATNDRERVASLMRAADLYKGPLLVGWYEEWIDLEQTRLAEVYAAVLRRLTALLIAGGDYDRAFDYAHRAVHADPLREEANRNLMRLYAAVGQAPEALEQYRKLESLLDSELDAKPSAATRELMKQISSGNTGVVLPRPAASAPVEIPRPGQSWIVEPQASNAVLNRDGKKSAFVAERASDAFADSGSVPIQFTRFFGREHEISDLSEMLLPGANRLVTITGPGGTGKTRLSVELASKLRNDFYGGKTWVVPLASLTDGAQIPSAILGVLRQPAHPELALVEQIAEILGSSPALIVLDNLEQMVESAARVIEHLLVNVPGLTILTTSRQCLEIIGERDYPLEPLPIPTSGSAKHESLSTFASIAMFVDRARAVRPDFQITPRNAAAIAELCRRLDGLPLALELAAASIRLLSPAQMLERLDANATSGTLGADLLASERREFSARHRSLRSVMDDSYDLLSDELRTFFAQLSVFRGGWTLNAAQEVCREGYALDLLDLLNHRSLVVVRENESGMRFHLLETIRQYAEGKLDDAQRRDLTQRHSTYYCGFASQADNNLTGADADSWCDLVETEHDNLRVALINAIQSSPATALALSAALWRFWYARGYAAEGLKLIELSLNATSGAIPVPTIQEIHKFKATHGAGRLALSLGETGQAARHFNAALTILNALELDSSDTNSDFLFRAMLMNDIAIAAEARGDSPTAQNAYRELVRLYQACGDTWAEAYALSALGSALQLSGDEAEARTMFDTSAALRLSIGDRWGAAELTELLKDTSSQGANPDPSTSVDARVIAASYLHLGHIASERGDKAAAIPLLRDALSAYDRVGDNLGAAIANERIAVVSLRQGDLQTARRAIDDAVLLRRPDKTAITETGSTFDFTRRLLQEIEQAPIA